MSLLQLRVLGGQMARVSAEETAFAHRDKPYMLSAITAWGDPAETARNQGWVQRFWDAVRRVRCPGPRPAARPACRRRRWPYPACAR